MSIRERTAQLREYALIAGTLAPLAVASAAFTLAMAWVVLLDPLRNGDGL